jgi:hypothetical protein
MQGGHLKQLLLMHNGLQLLNIQLRPTSSQGALHKQWQIHSGTQVELGS